MPLSFALSITHFVSSVGADAGFAALLGLAILVLLYFAHARETSNLRKALEDADQRLVEMERHLAAGTAPAVGAAQPVGAATASRPAAPVPAPPGVTSPAVTPATAPRPVRAAPLAAPAGVGAPSLSDATRVVPGAQEEPGGDHEGALGDNHGAGEGVSAEPVAAAPVVARTPSSAPPDVSPAVGKTPSPVTAAAGGNGFSATRPPGAADASRSLLEHGIPGQRRRTARWLVPVLALVAAVIIAVVLVLVLRSGNSNHAAAAKRHHAPSIAAAPRGIAPSTVTVALVNGTKVNQLAHHVGARLTKQGFKEGTLTTATNQSATKTTVGYLPGQHKEALAVAHALKLPASAVGPASHSSEALACPTASSCTADVIVVVGSNLAPKH